MNIVIGAINQGLTYAILAFGIYITYKILDFPDLTVDGSFPLGGAVTAYMITTLNMPTLAILVSFLAGMIAGACTGIIHVKLKVRDLLAGIIMMTALKSMNLLIAGSSNVPLYSYSTIFDKIMKESPLAPLFDKMTGASMAMKRIVILLVFVLVIKLMVDFYMNTKAGYLLRAVGDNEVLATSLAKDKGLVKIFGLSLANGLVAMSGSIFVQDQTLFELDMGSGMMVMGLASVIIGYGAFKAFPKIKGTTAAIVGCIIYRGVWAAVLAAGVRAVYMNMIAAILLLVFLVISRERKKKVKINA
jgi:ABC-type uncharacterized transport system, permease component